MRDNNNFEYDLLVGKRGEKIVWGVLENDPVEVKSEQTKINNNWTKSASPSTLVSVSVPVILIKSIQPKS